MPLNIDWTAVDTVVPFLESDAKMRVLMGPVGSTKSVTCIFEIIRRASQQAPGKDGIRRSRCLVIRQTVRQLQDTTVKSFLDWLGHFGTYMRTTKTFLFKLGDVECEILFRGLDEPDDVRNLLSLEVTFAWVNEAKDINADIMDALSKRIGRYPSAKDGGPTWFGVWADTNPCTIGTWWWAQMEHLDPKDGVSPNDNGWFVVKQPSGRSQEADWLQYLPEGYYDIQGRSDEYIRTYIDGQYGHSLAGRPIFSHFNADYHISKTPLIPIQGSTKPIIVGIDLGLTPAAVIGQQDYKGRMLIYAEAVAFDMGIQRFSRTILKPLLAERFGGQQILVVVDPAGVQRAQTDERSAVDILRAEGFRVVPARTNSIVSRLSAVDDYLMRQVDGAPSFVLDPRCTRLKAAMMGGYMYKKTGEVIDKNDHSHIAEALQYFALHINSSVDFANKNVARPVKQVSAAGWT